MKIAYIELDTHAEIASQFYKISKDLPLEIDFFLSKKIANRADIPKEKIVETDVNTIEKKIQKNQYNLLIIGTIHRNFNLYKRLVEKYNCAIIVHNKNFSQAGKFQLLQSIFQKDFLFRLKLLVKEKILSAPKIYREANARLVLEKNLEDGKHQFFPIFFTEIQTENSDSETLKITIPGSVSAERRDYKKALEIFKQTKFPKKTILTLAGKTDEFWTKEIKEFNKNLPPEKSVEFFTKKISAEKFDKILAESDFLWSPLVKSTEFMGVTEHYGISKMSGNIGDAIRFGKNLIVPDDYPNPENFMLKESDFFSSKIFAKQNFEVEKETVMQSISSLLENL